MMLFVALGNIFYQNRLSGKYSYVVYLNKQYKTTAELLYVSSRSKILFELAA